MKKTDAEPKAEEFEYAILYEVNDQRDTAIKTAKSAHKALKKFEKDVTNYRLVDIHKV